MEIACGNLAAEIVAVNSLRDPEIHADTRLAGNVRPPGAMNVLLGEEASAARPGLDLPALLAEDVGHVVYV